MRVREGRKRWGALFSCSVHDSAIIPFFPSPLLELANALFAFIFLLESWDVVSYQSFPALSVYSVLGHSPPFS